MPFLNTVDKEHFDGWLQVMTRCPLPLFHMFKSVNSLLYLTSLEDSSLCLMLTLCSPCVPFPHRAVYVGKQGSPRKHLAAKKQKPPLNHWWRPTRSTAGCLPLCLTAESCPGDPLAPALAGQPRPAPTRKTTHHANSICHLHYISLDFLHSRFCVPV